MRNTGKLSNNTGGFLIGADHSFDPNVRAGAFAGYTRSSFDMDSRRSSGDSDNYHLGIYGAGKMNAFTLRGGVGYTWHDVETKRSVAFDLSMILSTDIAALRAITHVHEGAVFERRYPTHFGVSVTVCRTRWATPENR